MKITNAAHLVSVFDDVTTPAPETVRAIMAIVGSRKPEEEAAALIGRFETMPGILEATPEALRETVAPSTADRVNHGRSWTTYTEPKEA